MPFVFWGFIFFSSCNNNSVHEVATGINVVSKCCNGLLGTRAGNNLPLINEPEKLETGIIDNAYPLFPEYNWDTKMMIW